MQRQNIKLVEKILLLFVWILLLSAPMLFTEWDLSNWRSFFPPLAIIISLFIVFIINRFVLVPGALLKKKYIQYISYVTLTITFFTFCIFFIENSDTDKSQRIRPDNNFRLENQYFQSKHSISNEKELSGPKHLPEYANFLIFAILLVGFDSGLRLSFKLIESEKEKSRLEKENLAAQLAFLKNQISPHFFMNTLNNIHALIDFDTEKAKESTIRLSKLMRHLLYEAENPSIPIAKEIEFVRNYVDLMRLRYNEKVTISLNLPEYIPEKFIPPLLFTSYLENAFKHGISYQKNSEIFISFDFNNDVITFIIENTNNKELDNNRSGIGIENSKKRLELLYGDKYELKIDSINEKYIVNLIIPL